jgi:hypothetical protein
MAFGVGTGDWGDNEAFSNWFPDDKPDKMEAVLEKLQDSARRGDLSFYIDMGMEFYIFKKGDNENKIYSGTIHEFIEDLMKYFDVKDEG